MVSLHLRCAPEEVDRLSGELWERGTAGIREVERGEWLELIAGFEDTVAREELGAEFAAYSPEWETEDATDWVRETERAWPPRPVGERLFLAPPWTVEATPAERVRIWHNPGLASGTGEHACTQLALEALERTVTPGCTVADIGTGSGLLALGALALGAGRVVATDTDQASLQTARENFALNGRQAPLVVGSADCLRSACAHVTVANISGTVLLAILDELVRATRPGGQLILSGLPEWELPPFRERFPGARVTALNEWRCLITAS